MEGRHRAPLRYRVRPFDSSAHLALGPAGQAALLGLLVLSGAIWLGGWVALFLLARSTTATLSREARVAFFRHFGRRYGVVATGALLVGLTAGILLLAAVPWTRLSTCLVAVAAILLLVLGVGVLQARRMTRLRRALLATSADTTLAARVARGARTAIVLRAAIGAISLLILVLAVLRAV